MMLFIGEKVLPSSRLIDIVFVENAIKINYDGGDLLDVEGTFYRKVETERIILESADEVNKIKRQFYKACASNQNAFYFG